VELLEERLEGAVLAERERVPPQLLQQQLGEGVGERVGVQRGDD